MTRRYSIAPPTVPITPPGYRKVRKAQAARLDDGGLGLFGRSQRLADGVLERKSERGAGDLRRGEPNPYGRLDLADFLGGVDAVAIEGLGDVDRYGDEADWQGVLGDQRQLSATMQADHEPALAGMRQAERQTQRLGLARGKADLAIVHVELAVR